MNRLFHLICLLAVPVLSRGEKSPESLPAYSVTEKGIDRSLSEKEALFEFIFRDEKDNILTSPVKFSYNGIEKTLQGDKKGSTSLKLKPGKYRFQFFYNFDFKEIFTDSIVIRPANKILITTRFKTSDIKAVCFKPVIYLYPPVVTNVFVGLKIQNDFSFTYPAYKNGWNVTAHPDGKLQQGDQTYNYLFWEGETGIGRNINWNEGFVAGTSDLTGFFEEKLSHMGLTSTEIQDYITYWIPRMMAWPKHYIRFMVNSEYDQYATLTVQPQPDHLVRVFMIWSPLEQHDEPQVQEQILPILQRGGFTLVEWGGTQLQYPSFSITKQ